MTLTAHKKSFHELDHIISLSSGCKITVHNLNIWIPLLIYARWNLSFLLFGMPHFKEKGCQVIFYYLHVYSMYLMQHSVDPDQMPQSAVSDLGLHCSLMSFLWDARNK